MLGDISFKLETKIMNFMSGFFRKKYNQTSFLIFTQSLLNPPFCVESVNVLVCAMCFFFNKQFRTCANGIIENEYYQAKSSLVRICLKSVGKKIH
jgi:hypothetical protein